MGHPLCSKNLRKILTIMARFGNLSTNGTLIRVEEGPKVLASPPTDYIDQVFFSFVLAVYTLGGYDWRDSGDF